MTSCAHLLQLLVVCVRICNLESRWTNLFRSHGKSWRSWRITSRSYTCYFDSLQLNLGIFVLAIHASVRMKEHVEDFGNLKYVIHDLLTRLSIVSFIEELTLFYYQDPTVAGNHFITTHGCHLGAVNPSSQWESTSSLLSLLSVRCSPRRICIFGLLYSKRKGISWMLNFEAHIYPGLILKTWTCNKWRDLTDGHFRCRWGVSSARVGVVVRKVEGLILGWTHLVPV